MRLSLYLLLLLPIHAISAPPNCDQTDLLTPGDQIGVCTSFITTADITIPPATGLTRIFITGITGNVEINHNITIDGGDGGDNVPSFSGGNGLGGPGAHDGGGSGFGGPEDGGPGITEAPDGKLAITEGPCASGGGGAGFALAGDAGATCATSTPQANAGDAVTTEFAFTFADFRGGFGGGVGGEGASAQLGAGGGGGGSLHIEATGTITIASGVTISAKGGSGGDDNTDGGGGGGGSGGAIWLVSATGITNNGTINVSGGSGGRNNITNGHGGAGKSGRFRLESAGIITNGTGVSSPGSSSSSASATKLSSDISCGTITKKDDHKNIFSVMIGFFLIFLLGFLSSFLKLKRIRVY